MVLFRYLRYGFRDMLRNLWRHKGMVTVSIITVTVMLTVLGATVMLAANSSHMANDMEDDLEIVVFLNSDVTREEAMALQNSFASLEGYESSVFVPKEDALESISDKFDATHLTGATGGVNPLPDAYHIKLQQIEQMDAAAKVLGNPELYPQIELVRYGEDVVSNLISLTATLEKVCLVVIIAIGLIALFLVNSTIRLTVAARGEEINIMKYVGATNTYIRIPFFLEGLVIGVVGAFIADLVLYFGYGKVLVYLKENVGFLALMDGGNLLLVLLLALLIGGMLVGALGSNMALRKYLHV